MPDAKLYWGDAPDGPDAGGLPVAIEELRAARQGQTSPGSESTKPQSGKEGKMAAKRAKQAERFVVVTTDINRRGVFGGILESAGNGNAVLKDARMCVYWSRATKGVVGLAAIGPQTGSRVSAPAPRVELDGVTAIMDCTPDARALWEGSPWKD